MQAEGTAVVYLCKGNRRIYFSEPIIIHGAVAQLGERDVRNVEARGSIPLSSTSASLRIMQMAYSRRNASKQYFPGYTELFVYR